MIELSKKLYPHSSCMHDWTVQKTVPYDPDFLLSSFYGRWKTFYLLLCL